MLNYSHHDVRAPRSTMPPMPPALGTGVTWAASAQGEMVKGEQLQMKRDRTVVVAGALRRNRLGLLVAKRPSGKALAGLWEIPGGKVEVHESLTDALCRELREELGISISDASALSLRLTFEEGDFVVHMFDVSRWHGEPCAKEGQEIMWTNVYALRRMSPDKLLHSTSAFVNAVLSTGENN